MESKWFCKIHGEEMGPLTSRELVELARSGRLTKSDLVRRQGNNKWIHAQDVKDLFRLAAEPATTDLTAAGKTGVLEPSVQVMHRPGKRRLLTGSGVAVAATAVLVGVSVWNLGRTSPDAGLPAGLSEPGDADKLTACFTQDFHEQFQPQFLELMGGSRPDQYCKLEATAIRPADVQDGLSNTAAFSERILGDDDDSNVDLDSDFFGLQAPWTEQTLYDWCVQLTEAQAAVLSVHDSNGGMTWLEGNMNWTRYNHLLTPGRQSCKGYLSWNGAGMTANSHHTDGVNLLLGDSSVRFVSESIALDVWRAVGTIAGGETVSQEAF